jgi:hypothetical protein
MPRVILDRDEFEERIAIQVADGVDLTFAIQVAGLSASMTRFSRAATALANGDLGPAKEMCRREAERHGRARGVELMRALQEAVRESVT